MRYINRITILLMLFILCGSRINVYAMQPVEPGNDDIWMVDVGTGVFERSGKGITIYKDGAPVSGIVELHDHDQLVLVGRDEVEDVHVYLIGENDFEAELEINGEGEVAVGRLISGEAEVPVNVTLSVKFRLNPADNPDAGYPGRVGPDSDYFVNRVFDVDFGTGSWTIPGYDEPVTAWLKGSQAEGVRVAESAYVIKLENFDSETMKAFVYADDGFTVELVPTEDNEVSLWHYEPSHAALPRSLLHFGVEKKNSAGPQPGPQVPGTDDPGNDNPGRIEPGEEGFENRVFSVDFGSGSWEVPLYDKPVTAWIDGSRAEGVQDVEMITVIRLEGFDSNTMRAFVYADDGFTAALDPTEDNEVSLWRYSPDNFVLPNSKLHFGIDKNKKYASEEVPGYSDASEATSENTETSVATEKATEQSESERASGDEGPDRIFGLPIAAFAAMIAGAVLLLIIIIAVIVTKTKHSADKREDR